MSDITGQISDTVTITVNKSYAYRKYTHIIYIIFQCVVHKNLITVITTSKNVKSRSNNSKVVMIMMMPLVIMDNVHYAVRH